MWKKLFRIMISLTLSIVLITEVGFATSGKNSAEIVLGEDNVFVDLYGGTPVYADDYQFCIEDMVLKIADAFNSGRLGTRNAQLVIKGLVPEVIYSEKDTNDDKMQAIWEYFCYDKLVKYFTISFDRQGEPWKCELRKEGVKAYVEDGISCGVFTGSWKHFELNPSIGTFDEFCDKMCVTKELAVALFFVIQSYDINWVEGQESVLLDELVDNQVNKEPKYLSAIALKEANNYVDALALFTDLNGYKDSESQIKSCQRELMGITAVTVNVTGKNVYLRKANGGTIVMMPKGASLEITGYDESCDMFTAIYGDKDGYVKGAGFSVSKEELNDMFK